MPDLGKYALTVLSAYGVSLALLAALILLTLWRGRSVRRQLAEAEARTAALHQSAGNAAGAQE